MLNQIRKILIVCAILLFAVLAVLFVIKISFKPTQTPAYGVYGQSSVSSNVSKADFPASDSSSTESYPHNYLENSSTNDTQSEISSSENSSPTTKPETPSSEGNSRLRELQLRLKYDEHWNLLLSDNQKQLADSSLFVGDSICSGFSSYGLTSWKNSYAAGSVGSRNFFDSEIKYFGEVKSYDVVLAEKNPERIFLWMGMNDVNMISADEYAEDYKKIIDFSLENSKAEVYVCAMTPVNSDFTSNKRITQFNQSLKTMIESTYTQRVHFMDFAYVVIDSFGMLCENYDSGDGVHLAPDVYYLAMIEICDQLGIPS